MHKIVLEFSNLDRALIATLSAFSEEIPRTLEDVCTELKWGLKLAFGGDTLSEVLNEMIDKKYLYGSHREGFVLGERGIRELKDLRKRETEAEKFKEKER